MWSFDRTFAVRMIRFTAEGKKNTAGIQSCEKEERETRGGRGAKADPQAPIDRTTHAYKRYGRFDAFVRAMIYLELKQKRTLTTNGPKQLHNSTKLTKNASLLSGKTKNIDNNSQNVPFCQ